MSERVALVVVLGRRAWRVADGRFFVVVFVLGVGYFVGPRLEDEDLRSVSAG